MKTIKIAFFHSGGNEREFDKLSASIWIRCLQVIPYLENLGYKCFINDRDVKPDIVCFIRWQDEYAHEIANHYHAIGIPIIFDLCVNYFDVTRVKNLGKPVTDKHKEQVIRMIELVDTITCASNYITQRACDYHPKVVYIPDSIDDVHFSIQKPMKDFEKKPLTAIWSGISKKAYELTPILTFLDRFKIPLTIISEKPPVLRIPGRLLKQNYSYRYVKWKYESFPKSIQQGEICLSPRDLSNPYNMGHSLFKIGVFMTEGVPVIASPVPSYLEVISSDLVGAICNDINDWDHIFQKVINERNILQDWSEQAIRSISPYTTKNVVRKIDTIILETIK